MEIFILSTHNDMNNSEYEHAHILIEKYSKVLLYVILYNALLSKKE
jgi:hypothetical protein